MQDTLEILTTSTSEEDSVVHYGVRGMKWGHRKAMAQSMGITTKQLRKQIKADNKEAFRLGREATIADNAADIAAKKLAKNKAKSIGKDPTNRRVQKTARAVFANELAKFHKEKARAAMIAHREALIKKYGATNISDIKRTKSGRTNERIHSGKDHAINAISTALGTLAGTVGFSALGAPLRMAYIQLPASKKQAGKVRYSVYKNEAKQVVKVRNG